MMKQLTRLQKQVRHIELPPYYEQKADMEWLASQGFTPVNLPRKATWYKPDGSFSLAFTDPYHRKLYRDRGFTLKPPVIAEKAPDVPSPRPRVAYTEGQKGKYRS